jgi:Beta-galactosidase
MRAIITLSFCLLALAVVPAANAASGIRYGIQDDAWLATGPGTLESRLDLLESLGADVVRFNLHWNAIEPREGSSDWESADAVLEGLHGRGISVVIGLVGSPSWANGGKSPNYAPISTRFAAFAREAAERYPWVRDWLIWNEPNQVRWLRPTSPAIYVTRLLNPAYVAIHGAIPRARVGGGVTAPRASSGGVSPVDWIRGMRAAGARLDAYAHHPYPAKPSDSPFTGGCRHAGCKTITMSTLERLLAEVRKAWGSKRIWLTEYGYQTNPPDRLSGVSQATQARYLAEAALRAYKAPRVDMLIQYLVRDEPTVARWQSGLLLLSGKPKLSAQAFPLPLAQAGRSGGAAVLWGMVRPRSGSQTYRIEVKRPGSPWAWLGGTRTTSARGFVSVRANLQRGTLARLWSPGDEAYGVPVVIR